MSELDIAELNAIKTEIKEAIQRRLRNDKRSPTDLFTTASLAVAETLADMIFSAATDKAQATRLLMICSTIIESRWNHLAAQEQSTK